MAKVASRQSLAPWPRLAEKDFSASRALQPKAHRLIPGGAHTYAKGDDQYPEQAPAFIARGKGCHVWDLDGNEFIEYGMGLRAVTLGTRSNRRRGRLQADAVGAIHPAREDRSRRRGTILEVIDGADMVKFAKNGSDVTTAAVKLARRQYRRDMIAICGDHPFFSTDDWFIGTTEMKRESPRQFVTDVQNSTTTIWSSLSRIIRSTSAQIAMRRAWKLKRHGLPPPGYCSKSRNSAKQRGACSFSMR